MASPDLLTAQCKKCLSLYDKKRANKPSRVKAREVYAKTDQGKAAKYKARKKWANNNKDKVYIASRKYADNNPKKRKACGLVGYAIEMDMLQKKPCELCGCEKVHGHHDDYDKPLDVRWLCSAHHRLWHKENGEGKNAH